jgi:hypothetical protein
MRSRLHLTNDTRVALEAVRGQRLVGGMELDQVSAWSEYLLLVFEGGAILALSVESVSAESDDPREEYFRLSAEVRATYPAVRRWPEGPLLPWRAAPVVAPLVGAELQTARVVVSDEVVGGSDIGVRLTMSNGYAIDVMGEHAGPPLTLGLDIVQSQGSRRGA